LDVVGVVGMQVQYGSVVGLDAYMCFLLQVWRKLPRPRAKRAGRQAALRDLEEGRAPLLLSHRAGMGARGKFELPAPSCHRQLQANSLRVRSQMYTASAPATPAEAHTLRPRCPCPHGYCCPLLTHCLLFILFRAVHCGHDSYCFSPGGQERWAGLSLSAALGLLGAGHAREILLGQMHGGFGAPSVAGDRAWTVRSAPRVPVRGLGGWHFQAPAAGPAGQWWRRSW
jgi:hypothetical protein